MLTPEQKQKLKNAGYSNEKINAFEQAKFGKPRNPSGYFKRVGQAYARAGQEIISGIQKGGAEYQAGAEQAQRATIPGQVRFGEAALGELKATRGLLKAGLRTVGGVARGAFAPITEALAPLLTPVIEKIAEKPKVQKFLQDIQAWADQNPESAKNLQDIVDVATLGIGGQAEQLAKKGIITGAKAVKPVAEKVGQVAIKIPVKTGEIVASKYPKLLSIFTGEDTDIVKSAMRNPEVADLGIKQGDEALRKAVQIGGTESIKAKNTFIQSYNQAFKALTKDVPQTKFITKPKLLYQFADDLKSANVTIGKNGKLDFTISLIKANPGEISKIQAAYDALRKWKDFSFTGINEYKQMVGRLTKFATEAGGTSKSPFLGRFYKYIDDTVKDRLPQNLRQSYTEMNNKFSKSIDLYDDMVDAFNSGDPFTKLSQLYGNNKDTLRQIVDFYEKITGQKIAPIVAGRKLAEVRPAAFGFLNPRQWIDFFIDPKLQARLVTRSGKLQRKFTKSSKNIK